MQPDDRSRAKPTKGRGTTTRILHRFHREERERIDDGWSADAAEEDGWEAPAAVQTQVAHEQAKTILTRNDSPDLPFTWSINPYRGCEHGCIYCYARPTHSYLNLSPGLDFETRLVAKVNAADCLRRELAKASYQPSAINLGSATDCYQPVERELGITRSVLQVLTEHGHPFSIVTKSSGVERDLDLIGLAASRHQALVLVSITTLDPVLCRKLEPRAAAPHRRLLTVRRLAEAGVPVGVNVAPIIPFLNEPEIEQVIAAAAEAGAASIHYTVVRLPWEVNPLFQEWLDHHVPERAARIMARIRDMRGGKDYDADFAHRMRGHGLWAELIAQRVGKAAARHGLSRQPLALLDTRGFKRPKADEDLGQGSLF
ncbi:MAG: PA0069 family radical SAM protein [Rubrivivax sp.]|nr:MAG: PA0069 family radical SAM protein [Rubrivivax sp.]